jgi:LPS-assembly protein
VLYLYVPYRQQDSLPIFDTTLPDFNLVQLFRTGRYVGPDRLGDANQLAMGATTRLLDSTDARQYLSATLGGLYRFASPRVFLPGEPPDDTNSTDVIGEMSLTAYKNWSASAGLQWDPNRSRFDRTEFNLQYRRDNERVINAGYRFREDPLAADGDLEQVEASAAWPVGGRVNLYARYVYSLQDSTDIERLAGLEYRDCCWGFRFVIGQNVSLTGDTNNYWQLQIELKGLPSVGNRVDAFLAGAIRGYSATRVDQRSTP